MPRFTSLRVLALATALVALVLSGIRLSAASAARSPSRATAIPQMQGSVPYGYAPTQEGSGVAVKQLSTAADGAFESMTVQNLTTERITALRLVAVIERRTAAGTLPVRLFVSKDILVSIEPNETAHVTGGVLTASQIEEVARNTPDARLQTFFALQGVQFANAYQWSMTPNPDAHSGAEAIGTLPLVYPRTLIERDATRVTTPGGLCADDRGRQTSPGALVPILNEPGHLMRCVDARWVESAPR